MLVKGVSETSKTYKLLLLFLVALMKSNEKLCHWNWCFLWIMHHFLLVTLSLVLVYFVFFFIFSLFTMCFGVSLLEFTIYLWYTQCANNLSVTMKKYLKKNAWWHCLWSWWRVRAEEANSCPGSKKTKREEEKGLGSQYPM